MKFTYENIWNKVTAELAQEIIAFWTNEKALPKDSKPEARAQQAVIAMRDQKGNIAAICTAILTSTPRLRQPLYYYRTYCAEKYRGNHTVQAMVEHAKSALFNYNESLTKPEAIGIMVELENNILASQYVQARHSATNFSFAGYSQRDLPIFVYYFEGYTLQKPTPLQKQPRKQSGIQIN